MSDNGVLGPPRLPYGAPPDTGFMSSYAPPKEALLPLTVRETVRGCTVSWDLPRHFHSLPRSDFIQAVVVHDIADYSLVTHALVQLPECFVNFPTQYAHSYDVTVVVTVGEESIQGFLRFSAATSIALGKGRRPRGPYVVTIHVDPESTSKLTRLSWDPPVKVRPDTNTLIVRIWCGKKAQPTRLELDPMTTTFEIKTVSGHEYFFEIRYMAKAMKSTDVEHQAYYYGVGDVWFKSVYAKHEIAELHSLAINFFADPLWKDTTYLYRCKPRGYYDACFDDDDGIMKTYVKDFNGHLASPINGVLKGLFFYGRHFDRETLPDSSPFGDVMWKVPIASLIEHGLDNIYFADFYCLYQAHYVTLVIARVGTPVDDFCARTLVRLDLEENNWLRVHQKQDRTLYYLNCKCWVEIYFTDDLPLKLGTFSEVEPMFRGSSCPEGIPSNMYCLYCNPVE
uniref:PHYHIP_C domain-containing protein n=1 Tax=Panagrellus redivivus TaxID=6233 RepID=A0A7E4V0E6_PANRE